MWILATITYVLVIAVTIMAIVAYRYMDTKIRSDRHADPDQHN